MFNNLIAKIIKPSSQYFVKAPNFIDFLAPEKKNLSSQDKFYQKQQIKYPKTTIWDMPYWRSSNQAIASFLGSVKSKLILDLGSGNGTDTRFLLKKGGIVISLDSSEKCLKISRQVNENLHIRANATQLPFNDGVFDIVFGRDILHHLDEKTCLSEVKRVLKNGSQAVFEEPLKFNPLVAAYRLIKKSQRVPQHPFSPWYLPKLTIHYFEKCEVKFFYTILPIFYFIILCAPRLRNFSSKVYTTLFSRLDNVVSNRFPLFSWNQVIKFYK